MPEFQRDPPEVAIPANLAEKYPRFPKKGGSLLHFNALRATRN